MYTDEAKENASIIQKYLYPTDIGFTSRTFNLNRIWHFQSCQHTRNENTYLFPNTSEAENDGSLPLQRMHKASFSKTPSTLLSTKWRRKATVVH